MDLRFVFADIHPSLSIRYPRLEWLGLMGFVVGIGLQVSLESAAAGSKPPCGRASVNLRIKCVGSSKNLELIEGQYRLDLKDSRKSVDAPRTRTRLRSQPQIVRDESGPTGIQMFCLLHFLRRTHQSSREAL